MADGWLAPAERTHQVTGADLALRRRGQHAEQPQANGLGKRFQGGGQLNCGRLARAGRQPDTAAAARCRPLRTHSLSITRKVNVNLFVLVNIYLDEYYLGCQNHSDGPILWRHRQHDQEGATILFRFIPIGGFLGAGKTTTMLAAARQLEASGERVSGVTNAQGIDLIDTQLARATEVDSVSEVTGGCFCCRFDDLAAVIERLNDEQHPTVVLAEAVGSCTDLQSTVVRPLRQLYGETVNVSPLVVIVAPVRYGALSRLWSAADSEPDMAYLYRHQLDEADVIAINKADLLSAEEISQMTGQIQARF